MHPETIPLISVAVPVIFQHFQRRFPQKVLRGHSTLFANIGDIPVGTRANGISESLGSGLLLERHDKNAVSILWDRESLGVKDGGIWNKVAKFITKGLQDSP
jgi:hypothetical protein